MGYPGHQGRFIPMWTSGFSTTVLNAQPQTLAYTSSALQQFNILTSAVTSKSTTVRSTSTTPSSRSIGEISYRQTSAATSSKWTQQSDICTSCLNPGDEAGEVTCSAVCFVDDVCCGGTPEGIADFRKRITTNFKIRDFGRPTDFVGCEIHYDNSIGDLNFTQSKYIRKMGERYGVSAPLGTICLAQRQSVQ